MTTVSDSFTRANETPLAGNWATGTSDTGFNLTSNVAAAPDDVNDHCSIYTGSAFGNDQSSLGKLTTAGSGGGGQGVGLCVRHAAAAKTHYRLICDHAAATNIAIHRVLAGAQTTLVSFTRSWTDGATWELRATGPQAATLLEVFHNGVSVQTFTDNSTLASGSPGLAYSTNAVSGSIDDWVGTDVFTTPAAALRPSLPRRLGPRAVGPVFFAGLQYPVVQAVPAILDRPIFPRRGPSVQSQPNRGRF